VLDPRYVASRSALLDALDALHDHINGLVLIGAHAVYLHAGESGIAVADYTEDADLAINPDLISDEPLFGTALGRAGFTRTDDQGRWLTPKGVYVDLLVPDAVAGRPSRRSADLGPHGRGIARRAAGLEPALVDQQATEVEALEPGDQRRITVQVAGPSALVVAKAIKIDERREYRGQELDKDALDIVRLLQALDTESLAEPFQRLLTSELSRQSTKDGIESLDRLFARPDSPGAQMAARAVAGIESPTVIAASASALAVDLMTAIADL